MLPGGGTAADPHGSAPPRLAGPWEPPQWGRGCPPCDPTPGRHGAASLRASDSPRRFPRPALPESPQEGRRRGMTRGAVQTKPPSRVPAAPSRCTQPRGAALQLRPTATHHTLRARRRARGAGGGGHVGDPKQRGAKGLTLGPIGDRAGGGRLGCHRAPHSAMQREEGEVRGGGGRGVDAQRRRGPRSDFPDLAPPTLP